MDKHLICFFFVSGATFGAMTNYFRLEKIWHMLSFSAERITL